MFPDQTMGMFVKDLALNDVNSEANRQHIINSYRIQGTGGPGTQATMGILNQFMPTDNMFVTSRDEDKKFEVFPEVAMVNSPIYKVAPKYQTGMYTFRPSTGQDLINLVGRCRDIQQNPMIALQPLQGSLMQQYGMQSCPDNPAALIAECGDSVACMHDYVHFNSKIIGHETQNNWNRFEMDRLETMRQYNSCGPINIEYPEYLQKIPAFASGYLQGDVVRFDCFQTHWVKGDTDYKCSIVVDYNDPNRYRYEWNKGSQPWCRSREMDNFLKYLVAILGTVFGIIMIIFIFLACWCVKQKHLSSKVSVADSSAPIRPNQQFSPEFERKVEGRGVPLPTSRMTSPEEELRRRTAVSDEPSQTFIGLNTNV